jgi:hypothetical protein
MGCSSPALDSIASGFTLDAEGKTVSYTGI